MILQLCEEHAELADVYTVDQIRDLWTWWNCPCRIILDKD